MNYIEVSNKIKEIIIEVMELNISVEDMESKDLLNDVGITSIDAMEILVIIESKFEIDIDDEDLNADLIKSLDNLTKYTLKKLNLQEGEF